MKKNKVIFIGSSEFAVPALELLSKQENIEIPMVITQPDKPNRRGNKIKYLPVKQKAIDLGIKVYQPDKISSKESEKIIQEVEPDLLVVASYGQLLKKNILDIPKKGTLNIHGSLLPKYRGATPIHSAIINGDNESGVTIMLLDEGMDSGPIIESKKTDITDSTTVEILHDQLAQEGANLLVDIIPEYLNGNLKPVNQNEEKASYTQKFNKQNTKINWDQPALSILRFINGLDSFPSAYTNYKDKKIKLFKPNLIKKDYNYSPGTIISADTEKGLIIQCQDNCLEIEEIQYPGKKRMNVKDFFRGNQLDTSIKLD